MARITIAQFRTYPLPPGISASVAALFNGGSLMDCHTQFYRQTGIWIDDLTDVLQKMDAYLITRPLPEGL